MFEVVEEVSEAVFRIFVVSSFFTMLYNLFELKLMYAIIAALIVCLIVSNRAIGELLSWSHEIFVICENENGGGGRVYKFFGWANQRSQDENITPGFASMDIERPWYFRLWGWITGEKMERVRIFTPNHQGFLEGKKLHPSFAFMLSMVGGGKSGKDDTNSSQDLADAKEIAQLVAVGLLEHEYGKAAARTLVERAVSR